MFKSKTVRKALGTTAHYSGLMLFAFFTVFPLLWALSFALSQDGSTAYKFPEGFMPTTDDGTGNYTFGMTLMWFERVFTEIPFGKYFFNSVVISGFSVIFTAIISLLAAYPLARMKFVGRNIIFVAIIGTLMLPGEAAFVTNFITVSGFGRWMNELQALLGSPDETWKRFVGVNSYFAVIAPGVAAAFGIFLMKQAFEAVPQDLIDAARVDGATEMQILWRVMLPVTVPSLAALSIFTLVNSWNDFIWPSIIMRSKEMQPLAVGVFNDLTGPLAGSQNTLMAAIVLTVIPVLIFFAFTQRYFISGMDGAVK
ncbi:MAG: carbohydrate ABC transporter permease [Deefgea sp.]